MKSKTHRVIVGLAAVLLLVSGGCVAPAKTITTHRGCDTRVVAEKRGACHACLHQGRGFVFQPKRIPANRCVR